ARNPAQQQDVDAVLSAVTHGPAGFAGFLTEIRRALDGEPNRAVTLDDGAASIALVTAIYASARVGAPVDLPLPHDHPMRKGWRP
ncbi:MAG: gfo/Idh/MocA family oxidoreductase, partial [Pseudomonadota bacterium]